MPIGAARVGDRVNIRCADLCSECRLSPLGVLLTAMGGDVAGPLRAKRALGTERVTLGMTTLDADGGGHLSEQGGDGAGVDELE